MSPRKLLLPWLEVDQCPLLWLELTRPHSMPEPRNRVGGAVRPRQRSPRLDQGKLPANAARSSESTLLRIYDLHCSRMSCDRLRCMDPLTTAKRSLDDRHHRD